MKGPYPSGRVAGVFLAACIGLPLLGLALGCSGDASDAKAVGPVSQGIPPDQFDSFANLIRNLDRAEAELDAAQTLGNPTAIREKTILLAQQQQILTSLYIDKYGKPVIDQWIQTVRAAATTPSAMGERPPSMKELEEKFTQLGAKLRKNSAGHVTSLDCATIMLKPDIIKHLNQFRHLSTLNLSATGVADKHLVQLKDMTNLRTLNIGRNQLDGSGLTALGKLENLEVLTLSSTGLTDAALPHLEDIDHLKNIRQLNLEDTALSIQGYEKVTRLFRRANVRF